VWFARYGSVNFRKDRNQEAITSTWFVQIASSLYAQTPFDMYFEGASLDLFKNGQGKKSLFNWTAELDQGQNRPNVKIIGIFEWDFFQHLRNGILSVFEYSFHG
jgi:hypothetical protein